MLSILSTLSCMTSKGNMIHISYLQQIEPLKSQRWDTYLADIPGFQDQSHTFTSSDLLLRGASYWKTIILPRDSALRKVVISLLCSAMQIHVPYICKVDLCSLFWKVDLSFSEDSYVRDSYVHMFKTDRHNLYIRKAD